MYVNPTPKKIFFAPIFFLSYLRCMMYSHFRLEKEHFKKISLKAQHYHDINPHDYYV